MKKRIATLTALIIALLSLFGCAKTGGQDEQPAEEAKNYCFDFQIRTSASLGGNYIIETDEAVYFLLDGFMYFGDKAGKGFMPLCARPDCLHKDADCSAYIDAVAFTVYGSYIYYLDGQEASDKLRLDNETYDPSLWRMRLDGTAHEKVLQLPVPEKTFMPSNIGWFFAFTNKYLLYSCSQANDRDRAFDLFSLDLDTLEQKPVTAQWADFDLAWPALAAGRDETLYCSIVDDTNYLTDGTRIRYLCGLDCSTGELLKIGEIPDDVFFSEFCFYLDDDALYYTCWQPGDAERRIFRCGLDDGESDFIAGSGPYSEGIWNQFDWQNGMLFKDYRGESDSLQKGFYYVDLDFEIADFHQYTDRELAEFGKIKCFFQTENYLFGIGPDKLNTYSAQNGVPEWYINKADIGTGNLTWKRWTPEQ